MYTENQRKTTQEPSPEPTKPSAELVARITQRVAALRETQAAARICREIRAGSTPGTIRNLILRQITEDSRTASQNDPETTTGAKLP